MFEICLLVFLLGLMFYPGSSAVILAYDVTRRHTLDSCVVRDSILQDMDRGAMGTIAGGHSENIYRK